MSHAFFYTGHKIDSLAFVWKCWWTGECPINWDENYWLTKIVNKSQYENSEQFEKKHFDIFEQFEKKQRKIFRLINIQLILKSFQRGKLQRKLEKWEGTENKNRNVSVCMWMKLIVLECDVTLSDRHSTRSVQSEAVYRSQDFVMFFLESCEGLPGQ